jgi:hypothetical protein
MGAKRSEILLTHLASGTVIRALGRPNLWPNIFRAPRRPVLPGRRPGVQLPQRLRADLRPEGLHRHLRRRLRAQRFRQAVRRDPADHHPWAVAINRCPFGRAGTRQPAMWSGGVVPLLVADRPKRRRRQLLVLAERLWLCGPSSGCLSGRLIAMLALCSAGGSPAAACGTARRARVGPGRSGSDVLDGFCCHLEFLMDGAGARSRLYIVRADVPIVLSVVTVGRWGSAVWTQRRQVLGRHAIAKPCVCCTDWQRSTRIREVLSRNTVCACPDRGCFERRRS